MKKIIMITVFIIAILSLMNAGCEKISGLNKNQTDDGVSYVDVQKNSSAQEKDEKVADKQMASPSKSVYSKRVHAVTLQQGSTPGNPIELMEGEVFKLTLDAKDADGDDLIYILALPLNEKGEWQTSVEDIGAHVLNVGVSDGEFNVTKTIYVKVIPANRAPVLGELEDITVTEGDIVTIEPTAKDPNGDNVEFSITGFTTAAVYKTTRADVGTHDLTVTATDGELSSSKTISIRVKSIKEENLPPVVEGLKDIIIREGESFTLNPIVKDADEDTVTVSFSGLSEKASYKADYDSAGEYEQTIIADDGTNKVIKTIKVTIVNVNRAPLLDVSFD